MSLASSTSCGRGFRVEDPSDDHNGAPRTEWPYRGHPLATGRSERYGPVLVMCGPLPDGSWFYEFEIDVYNRLCSAMFEDCQLHSREPIGFISLASCIVT